MPGFTQKQVSQHVSADSCWVIYQRKVYDITNFVRDHPGGQDILLPFAGRDISSVLDDETFHIHSNAAYELLIEYYIGDVYSENATRDMASPAATPSLSVDGSGSGQTSDDDADSDLLSVTGESVPFMDDKQRAPVSTATGSRDETFLDLNKPLFPQLWNATYSKAFYLDQVHRPRFVPHYVPYFSNPWLDVLSRTNWYTIPLVWLPFVGYQLFQSYFAGDGSLQNTLLAFAVGIVFWTLLEYSLHRFVFHLDDLLPDNRIAMLIHFTMHGIHHHMPMDRLRLVMPPAMTVVISLPVITLAHLLLRPVAAHAFVAGAFFGYVCYDCIHYYLHHAKVMRIHFQEMKRYHLAHHYKNYEGGYGITSKVWDHVFGTVLNMNNLNTKTSL